MRKMLAVVSLFVAVGARAQLDLSLAPPTHDPIAAQLSTDVGLYTRETLIEVDGRKYRQITARGETFVFKLLAPEESASSSEIFCGEVGRARFNASQPRAIEIETKITRRTSAFIGGLKQACENYRGGQRIILSPEVLLGLRIADDKPTDLLRKKTFFINPFNLAPGFYAEW